jgi:hypothetical protein
MKFDHDNKRILMRQSWLNEFTTDAERARLSMLHPELNRDTDAASLGTGVHAAIEAYLLGILPMQNMVEYARHVAAETITDGTITWVDLNPELYVDHAGFLTQAWINDISGWVPLGGQTEVKFEIDTGRTVGDSDGDEWALWFEGTIDYIPPDVQTHGVIDWKTSGRNYQQWEKQRWALQPSIYTYACVNEILDDVKYPLDFHYGVMLRADRRENGATIAAQGKGQRVTIRRFESHGEWAITQALTAAEFVLNYGVHKPWPRNDQHALCSPKWCDFWDRCKGSLVSSDELMWKATL